MLFLSSDVSSPQYLMVKSTFSIREEKCFKRTHFASISYNISILWVCPFGLSPILHLQCYIFEVFPTNELQCIQVSRYNGEEISFYIEILSYRKQLKKIIENQHSFSTFGTVNQEVINLRYILYCILYNLKTLEISL